ncbi:MAG: type II secretion system protein GspE [Gammaproteobacteria bacterium]|nr:MAG: type II secretion system protein GspE [Gammaproteobacteria bacterium]
MPVTNYSFVKKHQVIYQEYDDTLCFVAPLNITGFIEAQRNMAPIKKVKQISEDDFTKLLSNYNQDGSQAADIAQDISSDVDFESLADAMPEPEDLLESADDAPVIRLINAILSEAIRKNASDIHIEPFETNFQVRFRVDGVMKTVLEPPRNIAPLIISRIKVMAKLDISEKRLPQDGRISLKIANRPVDVRVSTLPSGFGERIVMRLLDKQAGKLNLENLGMDSDSLQIMQELLKNPNGVILVTGPTGSGKTTSLYAALSSLNNDSRTILTVEDPIEYYIDGIGQTQVNTKVQLSFAKGLRAILRQDPDVVMVGEIRDLETAQIAVQASLTGHLVFSTLHTNSAIGAIARLRDMGVEPFLLSTSLIGVLSQRLVRRLCDHCKEEMELISKDISFLKLKPEQKNDIKIYQKKGCDKCSNTGYSGRTGIYEIIAINPDIQQLIHDKASELKIKEMLNDDYKSLFENGVKKILKGQTTIAEILRVTTDKQM